MLCWSRSLHVSPISQRCYHLATSALATSGTPHSHSYLRRMFIAIKNPRGQRLWLVFQPYPFYALVLQLKLIGKLLCTLLILSSSAFKPLHFSSISLQRGSNGKGLLDFSSEDEDGDSEQHRIKNTTTTTSTITSTTRTTPPQLQRLWQERHSQRHSQEKEDYDCDYDY